MAAEVDDRIREDFEEQMTENGDPSNGSDIENAPEGNAGWADAMAKILGKTLPSDKPPVLAKYKKGQKRESEEKEEIRQKKLKSKQKQERLEKDHMIPDLAITPHEKALIKIATRGVVKLFNAVSKHQQEMETKLQSAPTEAKKSKVMESMTKSAFLDMLKSSSDKSRTERTMPLEQKIEHAADGASWDILRDDFMMGAKMKDWDQEEGKDQKKSRGPKSNMEDYMLEKQGEISEESDEEGSVD